MTARDILNVVVRTGAIRNVPQTNEPHIIHNYVDWDKANTELLLMFRIGLDTELEVNEE